MTSRGRDTHSAALQYLQLVCPCGHSESQSGSGAEEWTETAAGLVKAVAKLRDNVRKKKKKKTRTETTAVHAGQRGVVNMADRVKMVGGGGVLARETNE